MTELREALEAAYDEQEAEEPEEKVEEPEEGGSDEDAEEPVGDTPAEPESEERKPAPKAAEPEAKEPDIKSPESWKPAVREHWAKLPKEVKEEVQRREREVNQVLQQSAGARKFTEAFSATLRPYEQMLRLENTPPLAAIDDLFRTSLVLRSGSVAQKAKMVADIVQRFHVPIEDLDKALVGEDIPDENGKLQQMLQQQLAPVTQFMSQVQQMRHTKEQATSKEIDAEIAAFSTKEFFNDVRDTMADILEVAAKHGKELTMQQAYDRAIALDSDIQATLEQRKKTEMTQKKRAASTLPSRSTATTGKPSGNSIRDSIMDSIDIVAGR